jgi:hypothetical protein
MGLQGHASRRAAQCRAMPFCPCYFGVDLSRSPELCWVCVAPERTGHPRSQRSAERAFTLDAGWVTVASALGQVSICAYLLLARTHRQPVIDGPSQSVTHVMGVLEQITALPNICCASGAAYRRAMHADVPTLRDILISGWRLRRWQAVSGDC